jgi:predicted Zn-dependent peptidase
MIHDDCDPFEFGDAIRSVTFAEVQALFDELFQEDRYAMSIVNPLSE